VGRRIMFGSEAQIPPYPFGLSDQFGLRDGDLTARIRREEAHLAELGFHHHRRGLRLRGGLRRASGDS
jgi:hypothetical protein